AVVRLASGFGEACEVWLDGSRTGLVGALGRQVAVPAPERVGHRLEVRCPEAEPWSHVWNGVVLPGEVLSP
ncbi:MAG: hypothetical protein KC656_14360, partial [Myxococcales bacterium]|nr:hypothetical protein [Myxococcales bacterium]